MLKWFIATAALGLVAALTTIGGAFARADAAPLLRGTVGPGFTITLTRNGKRVTRLKAGTYRIRVSDRSSAHNFELEREHGSRFERDITSVRFTGTRTITVRLANGRYKYYCEPHEAQMRGFFTVGTATGGAGDDDGADD